jgi:hypothetical protein
MNQKLTDLTQAALVRANRANLYEFFCYFKNSSYMEFTETEGISRWSCTFQYAWFNAILCARDATSADGAYLDESLAYFKARNTSEISLWLEDDESFAGWEALITPCGFKLAEGPYGISMDLNRLNETGQMPAETELKIVNDEKSLQDCAEAIVYGYGYPPDRKDNTVDFLL